MTDLGAEVERLMNEAWAEMKDCSETDDLNGQQRSLGKARMAKLILRLIDKSTPDLTGARWRVGRKVPRHLYAQLGPEPSDDDPPIGTLDTAELAAEAVEAHNARLPSVLLGVVDPPGPEMPW